MWNLNLEVVYLSLALILLFGILGANFYQRDRYEGPNGEALEVRMRLTALIVVSTVIAIGAVGILIHGLG